LVYLQASRSGTIDLTAAGIGKSNLNYSASRTTVYGALGLGYQFAGNLAVEGRYQYTSIGAKTRPANQPTNASASFPGFSAGTFTLGLAYTF
jgi:opacity protein-like surface antigen